MINWRKVFDNAQPEKGATAAKINQFVAEWNLPLTPAEVARVNATQRNPWLATQPEHTTWTPFDPAAWVMPAGRPVPPSYLSFCRYSDGGQFRTGDRLFQMWGTGLREFLIVYNVPQYMPLAVPFAFNGGGIMYMFDMRNPPDADGEYPIICAGAGCLDFNPHYSPKIADSFPQVCRERFNIERLRFGGVVLTADQWDVWTDPKPMLDECKGDRKLRLFACACARRVWHLMPRKLFREAIELAERIADGGAVTEQERKAMKAKCEAACIPAGTATANALSSNASDAAVNCAFAIATAEAGAAAPGPAWLAARAKQADLIREIFGNPLKPVRIHPAWLKWNNRTVPLLANRIYAEQSFGDLPVLADALEEAGCTSAELLSHLRDPREHVRGCWALDLLRDE